jgi:hypothetical protein
VTRGDFADLRVRRRLAQIADRLGELRARGHEMSGPPPTPELDRERLLRAARNAGQARANAAEAARLAVVAFFRSAEVHDRVADLYDQLAGAGSSDIPRYRREAERHRMLAAKDRDAAASRRGGVTEQTPPAGIVPSGTTWPLETDDRMVDND